MAFWSFWMVAASVLAALAAIVGLVLLRWTWQETKRAADVTREIGEAQVRAYMVFVGVQVVHKKDAGGFITGITLRAVLQNTGQSPAEVFDLRTVVGNAPPNTPVLRFAFDPSQKFKTRIEVGSGQQANSNSPFIRLSDFERIVSDGDWLYLYAEAAYRDVFHYTEGRVRPSHGAYFAARVQPALNMAAPRKEEAFGVPFTYCELSQFDVTGGYED